MAKIREGETRKTGNGRRGVGSEGGVEVKEMEISGGRRKESQTAKLLGEERRGRKS